MLIDPKTLRSALETSAPTLWVSLERCAQRWLKPARVRLDQRGPALSTTLNEVGSQLGYASESAERILALAVAYYLDERFYITNRERLGMA